MTKKTPTQTKNKQSKRHLIYGATRRRAITAGNKVVKLDWRVLSYLKDGKLRQKVVNCKIIIVTHFELK